MYVGIGRIGISSLSEQPNFKAKDFNVSEGRDYTMDAPEKIPDEEDDAEKKKGAE
jgi:membrane-associated HD superfamily phosphohydrolase